MTAPAPDVVPHSPGEETPLELFVSLSAALTDFSRAELWGTGMVPTYFRTIPGIVGDSMFGRFLERWRDTYIRGAGNPDELDALIVSQLAEDFTFGPLTRNLAVMWYLGVWNQLDADWRAQHGAWAGDVSHVISPAAYVEGLVWPAMHTHPKAAKQPGYGSWALPPRTDRSST